MFSALLLVLVLAGGVRSARGDVTSEATTTEDDSDSAPFMLLVEHRNGKHCAASLVSQRTALTSAECAGQPEKDVLVWAAAARANGAKRKVAARHVTRVATSGSLSLLELESAFSKEAQARPILMAGEINECGMPGRVCHAVRAIPRLDKPPRLRIVDATLVDVSDCEPAIMERAMCLKGPEMCAEDWGAGVVCGGKLCGVIDGGTSGGCSRTLIAHSVARYRRFLHCGHVLRACGRGDCLNECTEHRIGEIINATSTTPTEKTRVSRTRATKRTTEPYEADTTVYQVRRTTRMPTTDLIRPPTAYRNAPSVLTTTAPEMGHRTSFMWEPNRADFRSGEYGDNAAEYGAEEQQMSSANVKSSAWPFRETMGSRFRQFASVEADDRPRESIRTTDNSERGTFTPSRNYSMQDYDMLVTGTRSTPADLGLRTVTSADSASSLAFLSGGIFINTFAIVLLNAVFSSV